MKLWGEVFYYFWSGIKEENQSCSFMDESEAFKHSMHITWSKSDSGKNPKMYKAL